MSKNEIKWMPVSSREKQKNAPKRPSPREAAKRFSEHVVKTLEEQDARIAQLESILRDMSDTPKRQSKAPSTEEE